MARPIRLLLVACAVGVFALWGSAPAFAQAPPRDLGDNLDYPVPTGQMLPGADVSSTALIENANAWNGREVSFTGEAIGELMVRGEEAWIHMNDDAYMYKNLEEYPVAEQREHLGGYNTGMSVWIPSSLAKMITYFGDYKHEGDVVKVRGTFNAACREHGGDMDIHATSLDVLIEGHPVGHVLNRTRLGLAAALFVVAGVLFYARALARRRRI